MIRRLDEETSHLIRSNILLKNPECDRLSLILTGLIRNSIDSLSTMIKVNLTLKKSDDGVLVHKIKIIDNGVGISWRKLDSIDTDKDYKGKILNSLIRM